MALAADSLLGPYKLVSLIGRGAMGEVYRARDTRLNRDVAIKTIAMHEAGEEALHRFEQEAQAVSALNHPNILTVHDTGREGTIAWIVTELIDGQSLRARLVHEGAVPYRMLLDVAIQTAEGIAAAHDAGIVHRDLKPENIMITRDGRVKILDFGIAKVTEEARIDSLRTLQGNDTVPGLLLGTTAYMSPEQARGTRISYYTDQFSFGLILHEMATGNAPMRRDTALASLSAILTEEVPPLEIGSPLFQWLVKRLLHKEPDHRYGSMHDVLRELRSIRASLTDASSAEPVAREGPPSGRLPKWRISHVAGIVMGSAAVLLASGTFWLLSRPSSQAVATEYRRFVASPAIDAWPSWSPDGASIAYSSQVNGILQVFVKPARGPGRAEQLSFTSVDAHVEGWSSDSTQVLFRTADGNRWIVSPAGGRVQEAPPPSQIRNGEAVSRQGHLWLGNRALTTGTGIELQPSSSPDGREIAFTSVTALYRPVTIGEDGTITPRETRSEGNEPVPSPSGRQTAVTESGELFVVSSSGSGRVRVGSGSNPAWSPDGSALAYEGPDDSIFTVRLPGSPELVCKQCGREPKWVDADRLAVVGRTEGLMLLTLSAKRSQTTGSGCWVLHGVHAPGVIRGIRILRNGQADLVDLRLDSGSESVVANVAVPTARSELASLSQLPLFQGFQTTASGIETRLLEMQSDIWVLQAK
ncbi:MAG: serine/threonine-protein kinase [Bryobacteraceae bacterium]|nr:serine/threonine-protein kinase [Bryobacteraceae bacterium]